MVGAGGGLSPEGRMQLLLWGEGSGLDSKQVHQVVKAAGVPGGDKRCYSSPVVLSPMGRNPLEGIPFGTKLLQTEGQNDTSQIFDTLFYLAILIFVLHSVSDTSSFCSRFVQELFSLVCTQCKYYSQFQEKWRLFRQAKPDKIN